MKLFCQKDKDIFCRIPLSMSDLGIIIIIVFLAAGIYLMSSIRKSPVGILIIRHGGKDIKNLILPDNRFIEVKDGRKNWILEVKGSNVRVAHSDCPGKFCKNQGWISKSGMALICVPLRLQAELKGMDNNSFVDVVTR